eukprot:g8656.t1
MRTIHLTRFLQLGYHGDTGGVPESRTGFAFARVQEHVEELRRFFDLPPDELFLDEFYCALYKRILLQGRMYIFEHYLCFYSNVFGWVKRKVIPLREVSEVTKKRNYGFPNSIEVVWKKKEFFTSFLNRANAFTLLCEAVTHVRESSSSPGSYRSADSLLSSSNDDHKRSSSSSKEESSSRRGSSNEKASDGGEEDSDLDEYDEEFDIWTFSPEDAPAVPENMEMLCQDHYDVTVQEFFRRTLSLESVFMFDYHKRRGDTRYSVSRWERLHEISGSVRQATFVSPVKGVRGISFMSPKTTVCNQDHRLRIYNGGHLVFEISQVMKDIPYGDNFSVEIRWDVIPDETGGCQISIHVAVPFIRSVMAPFRSIIESNVMKEMQDSVKIMTEMLKDTMLVNVEEEEEEISEDSPPASNDSIMIDRKEKTLPSPVLMKLRELLSCEEGRKKLEELLNPQNKDPVDFQEGTGIVQSANGVLKAPISTPAMHQNTTTMNFQSNSLPVSPNWILFFCCLFILLCQIGLILLWLFSGVSNNRTTEIHSTKLNGAEFPPLQRFLAMEERINSILQLLNSTVLSGLSSS